MQILTADRIKDAALVSLAILCSVLFYDARELRGQLREIESSYVRFLSKKSKGKPLSELINQTTLGVFPVGGNEAVICGKIPLRPGP